MEYIKKEDLIIGEVYTHQNGNICRCDQITNSFIIGKHLGNNKNAFRQPPQNPGNFEIGKMRLATSEEKHWLNECIKLNKFIEFEEAMKSFIPEYVECIKLPTVNNLHLHLYSATTLGKIYKVKDWKHTISDCTLVGETMGGCNRNRFKPSTKEAYDAQFVVKELEFVLPEKWCVKVNDLNRKFFQKERGGDLRDGFITSNNYPGIHKWKGGLWINDNDLNVYVEITFEQFKKYVLKEEIVEEVKKVKTVEPLPQFKIIESIETITKVENNEGNQFFIGDKVNSEVGIIYTINGFKYNDDKTDILATTTVNLEININKIEHYIEPKIEFILPEKWCVKVTNENLNFCKSLENKELHYPKNYNYFINGYYSQIPSIKGNHGFPGIPITHTEITFDQFKKYVLKEDEKPIIIAESTKDMLDLKTKGIDSIVLPQETLLDKAKRLYSVGTKFKVVHLPNLIATVKNHDNYGFQTDEIANLNVEEEHRGVLGASVYYKGKWAKIIEYPHGFKVGDKIRLRYNNINLPHRIIKIEGDVLFYDGDNRVLAKNAIKVN